MFLLEWLGLGARTRAYLIARGHVYEGGFNLHVERVARMKGLKGWMKVTQLPMSSYIEIEVEGLKSVIDKYLIILRQGTPGSKITDIQLEWRLYENRFQDFRLRI